MNFIRFGTIAGAHLVVLAIIYLMSGIGNGDMSDEQIATAGANGIVNWSNKDPGAQTTTVSGGGFDARASDLDGFNEGDAILATQTGAPTISSRQRFEPTRPGGSASQTSSSSYNDVLTPVGGQPASGYRQPANIIPRQSPSHIIRYTVKSGDSLWGISKRFEVSVDELHSVNPGLNLNIQPNQVLNIPRQAASSGSASISASAPTEVIGTIYTVKGGDALSRIAARQGVTLKALRAANNLRGDLIKVGQKLVIPNRTRSTNTPTRSPRRNQGLQVVVRAGDTLVGIAERYHVTAKDLILHNNIPDPRRINVGQTLFIPGSSSSAAPDRAPLQARAESPVQAIAATPVAKPNAQLIPEDAPLQLIDEDDAFGNEALIEQPVIPIED